MANLTSAAGRLHALIAEGRKIPTTVFMRDAWPKVLHAEGASPLELLTLLASVLRLPAEAEAEIRRLDHADHQDLLLWVEPVQQAFSILNMAAHWEAFRGPFDRDASGLVALKIAANMIHRQFPQPIVEPDVLVDLLRQISDVRSEALSAEIDVDLKFLILDHLRQIEFAIETYHLRGATGIREAAETALGALMTRPAVVAKSADVPVTRSFGRVLRRVLLIVSVAADGLTLAQAADQLLLPSAAVESVLSDAPAEPIQPIEPPDGMPQHPDESIRFHVEGGTRKA